MSYQRFVAVGDSCAEGLDDPHPHGGYYRGWADLVAARLAATEPDFRYANLAVRGRRLDQIAAEQIPKVAALEPDLVTLFGGGNDVLTRGWTARTVAARVDAAVRALTSLAPAVVVFTLSDLSGQLPMGRRMRPRLIALNDAIREAAVSYGALLVDLWQDPAAGDLRYFGPDRLHLGEHGHRRVAAHLLERLGAPYEESWLRPLPGTPAPPSLRANVDWLRREVLPVAVTRFRNRLIGRSPGDGFLPKRPELLPVLAEEAATESALVLR
ncbi:SGNH/GDSL hydrolase family protein [Amycolatopsis nigrescens]|uniref:SGNH/GDSL hydrolase family protein n=1 Tax=Amycolatopsis nigrescens TaxID=381445 RepID=UPI00036B3469|nr:SGNH/GDSL hydrolase family protein [Amycolatopsis nigrescens]